jgi:Cof subfamily protein (haloacid dehalogenase superfamily)
VVQRRIRALGVSIAGSVGAVPTLFVSDLDGTLLGPDGALGDTTAGIVNDLIADGVLVSYATARSFLWARRLTARLALTAPAIVYNGAFVVDPRDGEAVAAHYLHDGAAATVLDTIHRHGQVPLVYSGGPRDDRVAWVEGAESPGIAVYLSERPDDPRLRPVAVRGALPASRVFTVTVIGRLEAMRALGDELRSVLGGRVTVLVQEDTYHPDQTWLEVTAPEATKAFGVRRAADLVGARRLVVFGDNLNDLPMFAVADEAYAVANAVPEVKVAAAAVIGSNAAGGVATWLRDRHARARAARVEDPDRVATSDVAG